MSLSGCTPPAASTPSGSTHPAATVREVPRLVASSSASGETGHTSTSELVRCLAAGAPATPGAEGGAQATHEGHNNTMSGGSPAASERSSCGPQVTLRGGGGRGHPQPPRRAPAQPTPNEALNTGSATELGSPSIPSEPSNPAVLTKLDLSQGSARDERLSMAAATGQKTAAGEGMGHNDFWAVGGEPNSGGFRATGFGGDIEALVFQALLHAALKR